jgi:hypothetical protein
MTRIMIVIDPIHVFRHIFDGMASYREIDSKGPSN